MADRVGAVILAAGLSRRMGRPKMALPWGDTTIVGQVARVLRDAGAAPVVAVTGGSREAVEAALAGLPVTLAYNPDFANDAMLTSLQVGVRALPGDAVACLVALGDQPQIEVEVARAVLAAYRETGAALIVPSYQMRRGHPWLTGRELWPDLLAMQPPASLKDFLNAHAALIRYLPVDTSSVLQDIDTPEDYRREKGSTSFPPFSPKASK